MLYWKQLFGHEGALSRTLLRRRLSFEMADKGLSFRTEVGDIRWRSNPIAACMQEQEFERLGGTRTHHVDVRLWRATNRI